MDCKAVAVIVFFSLVLFRCHGYYEHEGKHVHHEKQSYNGWYNNPFHRHWGSAGSHLLRWVNSYYADGVYTMRSGPNAREISNKLFKENHDVKKIQNQRNLTIMLAFFIQLVTIEIMEADHPGCPLEVSSVQVPKGDPTFDPKSTGKVFLPFCRAEYDGETGLGPNNPRKQVNQVTSWIDASILYGTNEAWITIMRSRSNQTKGQLREGNQKGFPPKDQDGMYLIGDHHVNENPAILSLAIILFRWHNYQAQRFATMHPEWADDTIFVHARRWVIATLQKIIMYDFLPALLNDHAYNWPYRGYNSAVNPAICPLFAGAAFMYRDTLIPAGLFIRKPKKLLSTLGGYWARDEQDCGFQSSINGSFRGISLCHHWWSPADTGTEVRVEEILTGMTSQLAERDDMQICGDMRSHSAGYMWMTSMDRVTETIMRGRDYGLPDFNNAMKQVELKPVEKLWDINPRLFREDPQLYADLVILYNNSTENLDVFVGGMLQNSDNGPGPLFKKVIGWQLIKIRDGDRYWYENLENGMLSAEEIAEINRTSLADILMSTTNISEIDIGFNRDVFRFNSTNPCFQPFAMNNSIAGKCYENIAHNYFNGNDVSFVFSCIALGIVPFICLGIAYYLTQRRDKVYGHGKPDLSDSSTGSVRSEQGKFEAIEWVHEHHSRSVCLILKKTPTLSLTLKKPTKGLIRKIDMGSIDTLTVTLAEAESNRRRVRDIPPFLLLHVPNSYDIVLRFDSVRNQGYFLSELQRSLADSGKQIFHEYKPLDELLKQAETREKRQQKLEHFFREAYAKAFKEKSLLERTVSYSGVSSEILETALSRAEFAEALGMRENDLFVQRMFACVAHRRTDQICFQDFLDMICKFARGNTEDKLEILFDMCDRENKGRVEKAELGEMLKSLQGAAGVKNGLTSSMPFVENLLRDANIAPDQDYLSRQDFVQLMHNRRIGIDLTGPRLKIALSQNTATDSFGVAETEKTEGFFKRFWNKTTVMAEENRREIIFLFLFFGLSIVFFVERFSYYAYDQEHSEARRVMGYGNAFARGGAAGLSFCFAIILLTVCRNVITLLRSTPLDRIVPFDSAVAFHRIVAYTGLFYSGNSPDLKHNINYWLYGTVTGFTGVALVVIMSIIYVFATPVFVRGSYRAFKITHYLGFLFYALTIAHSIPALLATPRFWAFVIGPFFIFTIDRLYLLNARIPLLQIIEANLLPSDVIHIRFKRPPNFYFRSGQYVRISCTAISGVNDKHAFSLASAPQDPAISLYIKAVGRWTWQLRMHIEKCLQSGLPLPQIRMDGPYGEGNQDWWNYEVAICIGSGIGITPYASILKDLVNSTTGRKFTNVACKKVYFFWICPKHEDWFVDVLREVEDGDEQRTLETHIYVTRFFHKFDLRTTMLYICEKHFRGIYGKSMFTNLRAIHHFGRPDFNKILKVVRARHSDQTKVGVFSCGRPEMNCTVGDACHTVNRTGKYPMFVHQYASF